MKVTTHLRVKLGLLPLLFVLSIGSVSAQTDVTKTLQEKLTARIAKLQSACAKDIKRYCKDVTPGEGRVDDLKNAISACKAEIAGICGKVIPGQGRIAMCLLANKSSASKDCADAIQKIEATASQ